MTKEKEYISRIEKPVNHTTSNGGSYITAFDIIRSKRGREVIEKHAKMAAAAGLSRQTGATPADRNSNSE
jgi:hypothetical protein